LVEDIKQNGYDLVILGGLGLGAVKRSLIGTVCERVVRRIKTDVLVVKDLESTNLNNGKDSIVVAIDGSPQSYHGLMTGMALAKALNKKVEALSTFDPYFHYVAFNSLVDVLSEEASKVFRFREQQKLHEEIIDTGLGKIYQSHLDICKEIAQQQCEVELKTTLMAGKAFFKVLQYVEKTDPWLLICGKIGIHSEENEMDIGGNAENLLRLAPCNVLLTSGKYDPPIDITAKEMITWSDEAKTRINTIPSFARGIATTAIHRYAIEKGHTIVSSSVVDSAVGSLLPAQFFEGANEVCPAATLQEAATFLDDYEIYICKECGYTATEGLPVQCPLCSAEQAAFQFFDRKKIAEAARREGPIEQETAFDGVKLQWTAEAKQLLRALPDGYAFRRTKARIEKYARVKKIETITREIAEQMAREGEELMGEVGEDLYTARETYEKQEAAAEVGIQAFEWTDDAWGRLLKIPAGTCRNETKKMVEVFAKEKGTSTITLELCEQGIEQLQQLM
jgi:nucleotide-binding universal stress UspA family protein